MTNKLETFAHFCVTIGTQGRHDRFFADKTPTFAATLAATSLAGRRCQPACSIPQNPGKTEVFTVLPLVEALVPAILTVTNAFEQRVQ